MSEPPYRLTIRDIERDIERDIDQIDLRYSHAATRTRSTAAAPDTERNPGRNNDHNRDRTRRFRPDRDRNDSHHANQADQARIATKRKTPKCHKCGGPHTLNKCPKVKDSAERDAVWAKFLAGNPSVKPRSATVSNPAADTSAAVPIRQQTPSLKKAPKYSDHQVQFCVTGDYSDHYS